MKAQVKHEFFDQKEEVLRKQGDTFDVTEARFKEINDAGYGDLIEKVSQPRAKKKED